MRDRGMIIGGLLVLLGLLTFPVWYNVAAGTTPKGPEPERPVQEEHCVAPVDTMRASHMKLLVAWRDEVVREGARQFVAFDGKTYDKNLTGTCMRCHTRKADFCDRCHTYAGVAPPCWDCHIDPKLASRSGA
jgi:[DsrC]-trisulfide reductase subunit J